MRIHKYWEFFKGKFKLNSWYERFVNGENVDCFITWQGLCETVAVLDIQEAGIVIDFPVF